MVIKKANKQNKLLLFGAGKTAEVLYYHLIREGLTISAFLIDDEYMNGQSLFGKPVIPFQSAAGKYPPDTHDMMIVVGYKRLNQLRAERVNEAEKMGYHLMSYVSPTAVVWDGLQLAGNCKIGEQTIIQPYSTIGKNVFIGSGCIVGHHSKIMDHCFIASGVIIGGGVTVKPYSFLGTGSIIRNDIIIGESSVIGAGVTLLENTGKDSVYINRSSEKVDISSKKLEIR